MFRESGYSLIVRADQMAALDASAEEAFLVRLAGYVRQSFPKQAAEMGDETMNHFNRTGVAKAKTYGLEKHSDLCRFVALRYAAGPDFDEDPRHGWVRQMLRGPGDASARIRAVVEAFIRVL